MVWYEIMPRPPDPDSKLARIIHDAQDTGQEMRLRGFKEVCARDGLEMNRELDLLITGWLTEHHWPPGNPQTRIDKSWPKGTQSEAPQEPVPEIAKTDFASKPTDLLVMQFNSIDVSPGDKMAIGIILRERGAYPKSPSQTRPVWWTPRYGSG
jgi:hypothetical protein